MLTKPSKRGEQAIGHSRGGLITKIHMIAASVKQAVKLTLSVGQTHDAPQGRLLLETIDKLKSPIDLIMDKAYEDDYTRHIAQTLSFNSMVPPKSNHTNPWNYQECL